MIGITRFAGNSAVSPVRRLRTVCSLAASWLAVLLAAPLAWAQAPQQPPAPVVTAEVVERSLAAQGTYVANIFPNRRAIIGSAVDGRVEEFSAEAGQLVAAGEELTVLRTVTINIERAGAIAERDLRQAELDELKNGSLVEEIALAEAQLAAARASAQYSLSRFQRAQKLFQNSVGLSEEEFEAARSESLRAEANVEEAVNQLKLVRNGPRPERIAQAQARLAVQEQIVASIEDRILKYSLRSPFEGYVSRELTEVGAWISQGDPVAEVVEIDPVEVVVNVPESSVRFVEVGQTCTVRVDALPTRNFTGEIAFILPEGDPQSRSFPVKVRVPNPDVGNQGRIRPGMLARVSLPAGESERALLVPKDALNLAGDSSSVMKVQGNKAIPVAVRQGNSFGSMIQVSPLDPSLLAPGDQVVVSGNERLRPGQDVEIRSTIDTDALFKPLSPN